MTLNTNQSAKHHTTINIINRYHHGVYHTVQPDIVDNSTRTIIRPRYPSSLQYDMTKDYNKTDGLSPTTRKMTGHNSRKTQSPLSLRPPYPPTNTLPT